jgi:uncharacterized RDD family membrane protein YckC
VCPLCRDSSQSARAPSPEETVEFGRRVLGRILDAIFGQVAGLGAGVMGGLTLGILQGAGVIDAGWVQRLKHLDNNYFGAFIAGIVGVAVSNALCGASPGKLILGMRVVRVNGQLPSFLNGVVRELGYLLDAFFFGLVGKQAMDNSPLKQRHGDRWANTAVVYAKSLPAGVAPSIARLVLGVGLGLFVHSLVLAVFFVRSAL